MVKRGQPGIDRAIAPRHGVSRGGQPLSYNRVPSPDLAPWIAWLYVTIVDAPPDYGPRKTLYNRYVRWAAKGVWSDLFHALAGAGDPPEQVLIDSSAVKAHRSASGGKGGNKIRPSVARAAAARPKSMP